MQLVMYDTYATCQRHVKKLHRVEKRGCASENTDQCTKTRTT